MRNERQKNMNRAGQLFWAGLSQPDGISVSELHQQLVKAGAISVLGLGGVIEKLEEMRAFGAVQKTDNNTYVCAPPGANRFV